MYLVLANFPAHDLRGAIGDHLIDVHMMTRPRPSLDGIDDELIVPFSFNDLLSSLRDCVCPLRIQQTQIAIDLRRRAFDYRHRPDECGPWLEPRNGKIFHCALRLCTVKSINRELDFPERITFDASICFHTNKPPE